LRYYNIPTLDQFTFNIAPAFYLTVRELLSRPGIDVFERHQGGAVTRVNEPIMELLGLRYIIADYELPVGTERLTMPLPEGVKKVFESKKVLKSPVRIYELPDPNLGDYSPTKVVRAKTAKEAIVAMSRPEFNGRQIVVTDDASIPDNLVSATGATMTVRMGGVALSALSAGQSVLVLPVQYSHCWHIVSGSNEATLFRANLMQLGVRFSGELRVELRQIFGPFWQSACRVADAADTERLRLLEAVGAAAEKDKIPGDGVNLIASPEALDAVIGNSAIASIKSVARNGPVQEYAITAQGKLSDHYAVVHVPNLTPGPYTLSMQVRAKGTRFLTLHFTDGANDGFAHYLLPRRLVWPTRLGEGDKPSATIQKIDDEWLHLTLTSTLSAETGHIIIQLSNGPFTPNGEAVTIRAVQLERGETATPYPGLTQ
jgi:hypothetical protein